MSDLLSFGHKKGIQENSELPHEKKGMHLFPWCTWTQCILGLLGVMFGTHLITVVVKPSIVGLPSMAQKSHSWPWYGPALETLCQEPLCQIVLNF